jgi:hypothetical protein
MHVAPQHRDRAVPLVTFRAAAMNLATRPAGTRPRSFTSMPCALAHSRTRCCQRRPPHHQPRPAETFKGATTWICERSQAREAIAPHRRLCADQITAAGGPRRVPFAVHQTSTGNGGAGLRAIRAATQSQSRRCARPQGTVRPSPHVSRRFLRTILAVPRASHKGLPAPPSGGLRRPR